ncbi:LysR family transcriptional regulator [Variovorax paradoxus]|jgi:DNA-binding transcriptional LysR family regulator|uniref:LysR family transcriptional regulator n=1 Tax=Variovorax paradoxus TaxID=34073 RepID=UPI0006E5BE18|nr:LysR family transcriptional regulator [Variovorax paradoxus]KPV07094.1 LysR family transcriptional regulator [Variovorax paradoxus]KPV09322.1 LysR family transcriptional regulator [Variovorax paradoxus]KPV21740.1 LysR family transcriptional regulator [Variovorax paradoxus]KPV31913.1 LysR family transcriptional regulator [Variovorax paradoxus]
MATSSRAPKPPDAPEPAASSLPLRALTLRQLQCFSVLVEEAHFGRAARRLAITQPALSNAIKQIEKLLGAQLLTRSTHRVELTPLGAEVLARTDFLVRTVEVALRDIESTVRRGRAFVRIGVIPSAAARVAAAAAEFAAMPGRGEVELAWRDAPSTTLLAELRSGQLDMAVAAITEPPGGLECVDLFRDPLVLVVRRDHALAAAGETEWERIGRERLVLFESGSMPALGNPARAQFAQGLEPLRVSYSETLYALVRGGQALGLMPRLYTASLRDPELVVLALSKPRVERRVVLAYLPGPMRNVAAQALIDFLRERLPQAGELPVRRVAKGARSYRKP